jgi:hypothetical protein
MADATLFLNHDLNAIPPRASYGEGTTIPRGAEILVLDYNHTLTEALVEFNGVPWRVDRATLEAFGVKRV